MISHVFEDVKWGWILCFDRHPPWVSFQFFPNLGFGKEKWVTILDVDPDVSWGESGEPIVNPLETLGSI